MNAEEVAYASFVKGKAIFYSSSGLGLAFSKVIGTDKATQIKKGHIFEKGNFIIVGNGKVDVTYNNGPVVSVLENSKYKVGSKGAKLEAGSIFFNNEKADDKEFEVDVNTYTVGVRGTEFLLDMNGVYVRRGEVEVTPSSIWSTETIVVKSSQQYIFGTEEATPIDPTKNRYIDSLTNTRVNNTRYNNSQRKGSNPSFYQRDYYRLRPYDYRKRNCYRRCR